jgi:hypothetical protein
LSLKTKTLITINMPSTTILTHKGSDRATSYNMSAKIVRRDDRLFVTWLQSPPAPGELSDIMLGVCDSTSGKLRHSLSLDQGIDNHCGATLALTPDNELHIMVGAHHGPFSHRVSSNPEDPDSWSAPISVGQKGSYPSMVADKNGCLHLALREEGPFWQLHYLRKPYGQPWEAPRILSQNPFSNYTHYMQSISVAPNGNLLLTFQIFYTTDDSIDHLRGHGFSCLESSNSGNSWSNLGAPWTPDESHLNKPQYIKESLDVTIDNHCISADNSAWLHTRDPNIPNGNLWRKKEDQWKSIDLSSAFEPDHFIAQGTTPSADTSGNIQIIVCCRPDGKRCLWSDPEVELIHLTLDSEGKFLGKRQLTETSSTESHWQPLLEKTDWTNSTSPAQGGLWLLHTEGNKGEGLKSAQTTRVVLTRLTDIA